MVFGNCIYNRQKITNSRSMKRRCTCLFCAPPRRPEKIKYISSSEESESEEQNQSVEKSSKSDEKKPNEKPNSNIISPSKLEEKIPVDKPNTIQPTKLESEGRSGIF